MLSTDSPFSTVCCDVIIVVWGSESSTKSNALATAFLVPRSSSVLSSKLISGLDIVGGAINESGFLV